MLEKIITFVRTIRVRKESDEYIGKHFPNKTEFMRQAIEFMADAATKRAYNPMGFVGFHTMNSFGCVHYYWGYYLNRQFVLVINAYGKDFYQNPEEYKRLIEKDLGIQPNEEVDYYAQYKASTYTSDDNFNGAGKRGIVWSDDHFSLWNFKENHWQSDALIKPDELAEMKRLMDMHNSHFILSRQAYIYERLYGATVEWDETKPFPDRCVRFTYKNEE